jgi:hypothetical protein
VFATAEAAPAAKKAPEKTSLRRSSAVKTATRAEKAAAEQGSRREGPPPGEEGRRQGAGQEGRPRPARFEQGSGQGRREQVGRSSSRCQGGREGSRQGSPGRQQEGRRQDHAPQGMKLVVVAVGQRVPDWAATAWDDYAKRFPPELRLELKAVKTEPRGSRTVDQLMAAERERIEAAIPRGARIVALDERGTALTTVALASKLKAWQLDATDVAW